MVALGGSVRKLDPSNRDKHIQPGICNTQSALCNWGFAWGARFGDLCIGQMALCRYSDGLLCRINISQTFRSPPSAEAFFPGLKIGPMHLLLSPTPSFAHMGAKACFPCRRNPRGLQRHRRGTRPLFFCEVRRRRLFFVRSPQATRFFVSLICDVYLKWGKTRR